VINIPPRGIGAKSLQDLVQWAQSQDLPLLVAMRRIAAARAAAPMESGRPAPLAGRAANAVASFAALVDGLAQRSTQLKVVDLIDRVIEETGFRHYIQSSDDRPEERWENILELREAAREFDLEEPPHGLNSLLERLSLVADVDNYEESEESLTLITLHQVKGLEFPVVFIVGLEEGLLPHSRSLESEAQVEEERRLCYVGITRAKDRLYLLRAFRRGFMGSSGPTTASRFLRELPAHLLAPARTPRPAAALQSPWGAWGSAPTGPPASPPARPSLQAGDRVRHTTFGEGLVVSCTPSAGDQEVIVQFDGGAGLKRLLLSYAPLEKLS
jgi:DNA helicase-2/ATP-dependent DNA helicase PcrA